MPISHYFNGYGTAVMKKLVNEYGAKKGKSVFYALSNKQKKEKK